MLIGLTAAHLGIDIRFRAHSILGVIERHVELSWEEAAELQRALAAMLQENLDRVEQTAPQGKLYETKQQR